MHSLQLTTIVIFQTFGHFFSIHAIPVNQPVSNWTEELKLDLDYYYELIIE